MADTQQTNSNTDEAQKRTRRSYPTMRQDAYKLFEEKKYKEAFDALTEIRQMQTTGIQTAKENLAILEKDEKETWDKIKEATKHI